MSTTAFEGLVGQTLDALVGASRGSKVVLIATVGDENRNWRATTNILAPVDAVARVEDVTGNQSYLNGSPLLECTETVENTAKGVVTTHTFRTAKGEVAIRWFGPVKAALYRNLK